MHSTKRVFIMMAALAVLADCAARVNEERKRAWSDRLNQSVRELGSSSRDVEALTDVEPSDDFDAYKDSMRRRSAALDRWDGNLARVQEVLAEGLQGTFLNAASKEQNKRYASMLRE
jgi:hypothetical protein